MEHPSEDDIAQMNNTPPNPTEPEPETETETSSRIILGTQLRPNYAHPYAGYYVGCSSSRAENIRGYPCLGRSNDNIASNETPSNAPPNPTDPQVAARVNLGTPPCPNYVHPYARYNFGCSSSQVENIQRFPGLGSWQGQTRMPSSPVPFWNDYQYINPSHGNIETPNDAPTDIGVPLRPNYPRPQAENIQGLPGLGSWQGQTRRRSSSQARNIQPFPSLGPWQGPTRMPWSPILFWNGYQYIDANETRNNAPPTPTETETETSARINLGARLHPNYVHLYAGYDIGWSSSQAGNIQPFRPWTRISTPAPACTTSTSTAEDNEITEGPESPKNLREWMESKGPSSKKPDKLRLFMLAARLVEWAHRQGKGMLDLKPSSFAFTTEEHRDLKYVGRLLRDESLGAVARKTCSERGISGDGDEIPKVSEGKSVITDASDEKPLLTRDVAELEKGWYDFPAGYANGDLPFFNVYCLGLLLCELLCRFESIGEHHAAMVDLWQGILPPQFVSGHPEEARFCYRLLHPEPLSRPTAREIMQFASIHEPPYAAVLDEDEVEPPDAAVVEDDGNGDEVEPPDAALVEGDGDEDDLIAETDLLLHFLSSSEEAKRAKALSLSETIRLLDSDIALTERTRASRNPINIPESSASSTRAFREKILDNIGDLETAYFSHRSHSQLLAEKPRIGRPDKEILRERPSWYSGALPQAENGAGASFDGIFKFARHSGLEVCGGLRCDDIMDSDNSINSISLDRDEDLIAIAGASKKIKIFEVGMLLGDDMDLHYPVIEFSSEWNFACVCWNTYIKNYLVSADYGGVVQIWDACTGQGLSQYKEHQERAWYVDFSKVDPTKFASGSDDCSIRIWSTREKASIGLIQNKANVCCVQFSPYSSHLLTYGSVDSKIYCYDLRHTKSPWCTIVGHRKAVSRVMFLDSEIIVSASTDNTLKLWDLNKTTLNGSSADACALTCRGHTNMKNFVGLTVFEDGYIACGSETNEVYAYHRSMPMPILTHKFESIDDGTNHFVSSVCWRKKSEMLIAANTSGNMRILRMV